MLIQLFIYNHIVLITFIKVETILQRLKSREAYRFHIMFRLEKYCLTLELLRTYCYFPSVFIIDRI